jgi:PD-(D/E)XK nuclease superfamily
MISIWHPFSFMNAIEAQTFKNFWFQSGTPTFLVEELSAEYRKAEFETFDLEKIEITKDTLGIFDVGTTSLPTLMFQTGYLTITGYDPVNKLYKLGYPNTEVKTSLQKSLLEALTKLDSFAIEKILLELRNAFVQKDTTHIIAIIKQSFSRVVYQEHIKSEKFYHALLQVLFGAAGIKAQSEIPTSHGRIDLVLEFPQLLYIIEVKYNDSAQAALAQIEERKYYEAIQYHKKQTILLGLNFERKKKSFEIMYAENSLSEFYTFSHSGERRKEESKS